MKTKKRRRNKIYVNDQKSLKERTSVTKTSKPKMIQTFLMDQRFLLLTNDQKEPAEISAASLRLMQKQKRNHRIRVKFEKERL